jgi:hypothetical protein
MHLLRDKGNKYTVLVEEFNNHFKESISNDQMRHWFSNKKRSNNVSKQNSDRIDSDTSTLLASNISSVNNSTLDKSLSSKKVK